jgi:histidine triad (HIT) family protein
MADCIFCRIIRGDMVSSEVYGDGAVLVFLDHRPLFPGHCLVVPRTHVETLVDLPPAEVAPLFSAVQRVAAAVESGLGAEGTFIAINNRISQSVPHLHVHVVPRRKKDGLKGFFWPRHTYAGKDEMARVAEAIRQAIAPAAERG